MGPQNPILIMKAPVLALKVFVVFLVKAVPNSPCLKGCSEFFVDNVTRCRDTVCVCGFSKVILIYLRERQTLASKNMSYLRDRVLGFWGSIVLSSRSPFQ